MPVLRSLGFKQWRWLLSCGWHWLMPKCVCTCSLGALLPAEGSVPLLFFISLPFWSYMLACALHVDWVYQQFFCLLGWIQLLQAWRLGAVECTCCGSSFGQPQYCACFMVYPCVHLLVWHITNPTCFRAAEFLKLSFQSGIREFFLDPPHPNSVFLLLFGLSVLHTLVSLSQSFIDG